MVTLIAFAILGGYLGWSFFNPIAIPSWRSPDVVSLIMAILISGLCAVLGFFVGWGITILLGFLFPQESDETTQKVFDIGYGIRKDLGAMTTTTVNSEGGVGIGVTPVDTLENVISYIYVAEDGKRHRTRVDKNKAKVITEDRQDCELLTRTWYFSWSWVNLFASSADTQYEFHVPEATWIIDDQFEKA